MSMATGNFIWACSVLLLRTYTHREMWRVLLFNHFESRGGEACVALPADMWHAVTHWNSNNAELNKREKLIASKWRRLEIITDHEIIKKPIRPNSSDLPIIASDVKLRGHCPWMSGGATSQLDLTSLAPLSVASCGRLQLGVPHWATSVITASSW